MPSPLLTLGDLRSNSLQAIGEHVQALTTALQAQFGGYTGLGKWVRHNLKTIQIRSGDTAAILTVLSNTGELSYTIIGDTMIVHIWVYNLLISGGTGGPLHFKLPDNWQYVERNAVSAFRETRVPVIGTNAGVAYTGFAILTAANPTSIAVYAGMPGNFGPGQHAIWLEMAFECQQIGERS